MAPLFALAVRVFVWAKLASFVPLALFCSMSIVTFAPALLVTFSFWWIAPLLRATDTSVWFCCSGGDGESRVLHTAVSPARVAPNSAEFAALSVAFWVMVTVWCALRFAVNGVARPERVRLTFCVTQAVFPFGSPVLCVMVAFATALLRFRLAPMLW